MKVSLSGTKNCHTIVFVDKVNETQFKAELLRQKTVYESDNVAKANSESEKFITILKVHLTF